MKNNFILLALLLIPMEIYSQKDYMQHYADSLDRRYNTLLVQKEAEIRRANDSRNLGFNFGLGGALLGFVCVSGAYYFQYRKTKILNEQLLKANAEIYRTQEQLIKNEKLAAYGIMASLMAHEIQNPLNFVNNFSELSQTLLQELANARNEGEMKEALETLKDNLQKINHHGKRAGTIVKELEDHSRAGTAHEYFET